MIVVVQRRAQTRGERLRHDQEQLLDEEREIERERVEQRGADRLPPTLSHDFTFSKCRLRLQIRRGLRLRGRLPRERWSYVTSPGLKCATAASPCTKNAYSITTYARTSRWRGAQKSAYSRHSAASNNHSARRLHSRVDPCKHSTTVRRLPPSARSIAPTCCRCSMSKRTKQTLVENQKSLSRTDTWTVEALRDIDELVDSATHEAPVEVRSINVNNGVAGAGSVHGQRRSHPEAHCRSRSGHREGARCERGPAQAQRSAADRAR